VAIACNLLRLVVTALLFMTVSGEIAKTFFHDFAGWTMMPLAIAMLAGELWIMSKLVIKEPKEETR
jgi:exosortase/archaeosortase family protein